MFGANATKIRAVILMVAGLLVSVGLLPADTEAFLEEQAEIAIGAVLALWGVVAGVRAWWSHRTGLDDSAEPEG